MQKSNLKIGYLDSFTGANIVPSAQVYVSFLYKNFMYPLNP